jgi:hypothetical protein
LTGIDKKDRIQPTNTYNVTDIIAYSKTAGQKSSGGGRQCYALKSKTQLSQTRRRTLDTCSRGLNKIEHVPKKKKKERKTTAEISATSKRHIKSGSDTPTILNNE